MAPPEATATGSVTATGQVTSGLWPRGVHSILGGKGIAIQAAMAVVQQVQSSMFLLREPPMGGKGMAAKGRRDIDSSGMTGMQAILRGVSMAGAALNFGW